MLCPHQVLCFVALFGRSSDVDKDKSGAAYDEPKEVEGLEGKAVTLAAGAWIAIGVMKLAGSECTLCTLLSCLVDSPLFWLYTLVDLCHVAASSCLQVSTPYRSSSVHFALISLVLMLRRCGCSVRCDM